MIVRTLNAPAFSTIFYFVITAFRAVFAAHEVTDFLFCSLAKRTNEFLKIRFDKGALVGDVVVIIREGDK